MLDFADHPGFATRFVGEDVVAGDAIGRALSDVIGVPRCEVSAMMVARGALAASNSSASQANGQVVVVFEIPSRPAGGSAGRSEERILRLLDAAPLVDKIYAKYAPVTGGTISPNGAANALKTAHIMHGTLSVSSGESRAWTPPTDYPGLVIPLTLSGLDCPRLVANMTFLTAFKKSVSEAVAWELGWGLHPRDVMPKVLTCSSPGDGPDGANPFQSPPPGDTASAVQVTGGDGSFSVPVYVAMSNGVLLDDVFEEASLTATTLPISVAARIEMLPNAANTTLRVSMGPVEKNQRPLMFYDCDEMIGWQRDWADEKKQWCCENFGSACEVFNVIGTAGGLHWMATAQPTFNCSAGYEMWELGWSDAKKNWCCTNERAGCYHGEATTTTRSVLDLVSFDCTAGYANWAAGWSDLKREWCCAHDHVACPVNDRPARMKPHSAPAKLRCELVDKIALEWSEEKRRLCCQAIGVGCDQDLEHWVPMDPVVKYGYGEGGRSHASLVSLSVLVSNLGFASLVSDDSALSEFKRKVQEVIAEESGNNALPRDVEANISSASVKVDVGVRATGQRAGDIQAKLVGSTTLLHALASALGSVASIQQIATGLISVELLDPPIIHLSTNAAQRRPSASDDDIHSLPVPNPVRDAVPTGVMPMGNISQNVTLANDSSITPPERKSREPKLHKDVSGVLFSLFALPPGALFSVFALPLIACLICKCLKPPEPAPNIKPESPTASVVAAGEGVAEDVGAKAIDDAVKANNDVLAETAASGAEEVAEAAAEANKVAAGVVADVEETPEALAEVASKRSSGTEGDVAPQAAAGAAAEVAEADVGLPNVEAKRKSPSVTVWEKDAGEQPHRNNVVEETAAAGAGADEVTPDAVAEVASKGSSEN
jgi:hypothetical protein